MVISLASIPAHPSRIASSSVLPVAFLCLLLLAACSKAPTVGTGPVVEQPDGVVGTELPYATVPGGTGATRLGDDASGDAAGDDTSVDTTSTAASGSMARPTVTVLVGAHNLPIDKSGVVLTATLSLGDTSAEKTFDLAGLARSAELLPLMSTEADDDSVLTVRLSYGSVFQSGAEQRTVVSQDALSVPLHLQQYQSTGNDASSPALNYTIVLDFDVGGSLHRYSNAYSVGPSVTATLLADTGGKYITGTRSLPGQGLHTDLLSLAAPDISASAAPSAAAANQSTIDAASGANNSFNTSVVNGSAINTSAESLPPVQNTTADQGEQQTVTVKSTMEPVDLFRFSGLSSFAYTVSTMGVADSDALATTTVYSDTYNSKDAWHLITEVVSETSTSKTDMHVRKDNLKCLRSSTTVTAYGQTVSAGSSCPEYGPYSGRSESLTAEVSEMVNVPYGSYSAVRYRGDSSVYWKSADVPLPVKYLVTTGMSISTFELKAKS